MALGGRSVPRWQLGAPLPSPALPGKCAHLGCAPRWEQRPDLTRRSAHETVGPGPGEASVPEILGEHHSTQVGGEARRGAC